MKRLAYDRRGRTTTRESPEVDAFLRDVEAACLKHGMTLVASDITGAIEVTKYNSDDADWLLSAADAREMS